MHELILLLASVMTTDEIIEQLIESIDEYKEQKVLNKNLKEAEQHILVNCALLMAKQRTGDKNFDQLNQAMNEFKAVRDMQELISPKKTS